jgi:hypothetical protein
MRFIPVLLGLLLASWVLWGVDAFCGSKTAVSGVVVGHTYTPETVVYTVGANNQLVPTFYPAQYYLVVRGPHGVVSVSTEPYAYMAAPGTRFRYTESRGLITGYLYSL